MNALPALLAISLAAAPAWAAPQHDHQAHAGHGDHASHAAHSAHDAHDANAGHAQHSAHAARADIPADHVPWTPDAPLRQGMSRVRAAMDTLAHHEMGHLAPEQARSLAVEIDDAIEYMFANCQLAPEPDVALHGVLARLMAGTQVLREDPADASPVAGMREALADYGRLFDDPAGASDR